MNSSEDLSARIRAALAVDANARRHVGITRNPTKVDAVGALRHVTLLPVVALTLVAAIVVGGGLSAWRAAHVPVDVASTSTPSIGPLALAGGAPSLSFGFISTSANTLLIRNETTAAAPMTIANALPSVAVSPNGHQFAYWSTASGTHELRLIDVFNGTSPSPGSTVPGTVLLRAPANLVGGSFVWSSDGTGIVANVHAPVVRGGTASNDSRWFEIDVPTDRVSQLPAMDVVSTVYAWDRGRDLITGSGFYAGQTTFTALQGGRITNTAVPQGAAIVAADAYARTVVITYPGPCKGLNGMCSVVESRDQATFVPIAAITTAAPTRDWPDVVFRPRSQDLIVQLPLVGGDARVELWHDLGRGVHDVLATYAPSARFTSRRELLLPRLDGSAAFILKFDDSAGGRWFGEVVALAATNGSFARSDFEIRTGGNPLASIVLDQVAARALEAARSVAPTTTSTPSARPSPLDPASCGADELPVLDITFPPPPGDAPGTGEATPEAAFTRARPNVTKYSVSHPFGTSATAPVWVTTDSETFIAQILGTPNGNNWFAYPARFVGCRQLVDRDAIAIAQSSDAGRGFAQFPSAPGSSACTLRGGGPAPGIAVPGTCRSDALRIGREYDVTFTITWDARDFHLEGEPSSGTLSHAWVLHIDGAGQTSLSSQSGNFPPAYVK